ncbi:MAG: SIS domain-containing protein [Spirochaetota bacterium]
MNLGESKYSQFALVKEMFATADVVKSMDPALFSAYSRPQAKVLLSGEGSSRIFPAKNLLAAALEQGYPQFIYTENSLQSREYQLDGYSVFVASNSGKTAEAVRLIQHLRSSCSAQVTAVCAHADTPIMNAADETYLLQCGPEEAVAATKSVVEQALFYDMLFRYYNGAEMPDLRSLADSIQQVLAANVPQPVLEALYPARSIYFAGRNNGVAEELRLKTNEITRRKSDYLEGTYTVHGIEEVMQPDEVVVVIEPFPEEQKKFKEVLEQGVGMKVVAIAARETEFPTFIIPAHSGFDGYVQLAAGWNLLVELGIRSGVNVDKPARARKVGNEYAVE